MVAGRPPVSHSLALEARPVLLGRTTEVLAVLQAAAAGHETSDEKQNATQQTHVLN